MPGFISRQERFTVVGSTNDVVRGWLADGTPEVCIAVADEQTAGRGRDGRTWIAPAGSALLLSLGFRPTWSDPDVVWRIAAIASVAMAEAAEAVARLPVGMIRLKWPNDLVVETASGLKKVGGVLGESDGLGTSDPRVVIGMGVNTDWAAAAFPPDLAGSMTSLHELTADHVDQSALIAAFVDELRPRVEDLRRPRYGGQFDGAEWAARQVTTGRDVDLIGPDGTRTTVRATGVDTTSGALLVGDRAVIVGEIEHVRMAASERLTV